MDVEILDEQTHAGYIIQQVLNYGTLPEFATIIHFYNPETIKQAIKQAGYFDPKTFAFVLSYFDLDKNELQCYTKKRLHQAHWI
ncbi:MAG: hypothetical protein A2W85_03515 [Bacteroidetes bacterium GWF2_41_31]|nr:MAG: hypothetical protein A2W85_03515 [Bacteroidetes bacterium GWF2_41_31]